MTDKIRRLEMDKARKEIQCLYGKIRNAITNNFYNIWMLGNRFSVQISEGIMDQYQWTLAIAFSLPRQNAQAVKLRRQMYGNQIT